MEKATIVILLFICLMSSSCSKEQAVDPINETRFAGNYQCSGQYLIYGDSTWVKDTSIVVTVAKSKDQDLMMIFNVGSSTIVSLVNRDGTFGEDSSHLIGKFTSQDSIYLFSHVSGHIGSREWFLSGKRK